MSLFSNKSSDRHDIEREIHRLSAALDELKSNVSHDSRHGIDTLRRKAESLWHDANWDAQGARLAHSTREAGRLACSTAKHHPVTSLALAAGAVALVGYLLSRR
ncbi:DUF883 family protein [Azomonas macrocytogenes]|uniref:ElaB/YqjD/DUF883 family membrane-anchored ribosome-binding protein n=1 Tax=Azomonas macrocytogenes TaxID=69962 RepID=A0A839T0X3_AZOMA|nr:DUF883 family protein [Azomonas macrocytogenes]MBB3103032.1 ElaB/YqjD/DUF883 family membrane-anchored ribosome-binding protein [Azomonas macrocytogenes]